MTLTESKKLTVLFAMSATAWDRNREEAEGLAFDRIWEAALKRGKPDMSDVEVEISRDGVINIGSEEEPMNFDLREHNLVLISTTMSAVPHEGEF